jgi:dephospho-CoA kinase
MLIIGLTGGIGSGKSTVADFFAELGIDIIDTDILAREVVKPGTSALKKIAEHFGNEILSPQNELDRKKLRDIVFKEPQQRRWLENLLHPLIRKAMLTKIKDARSSYCVVIIPLLIETQSKVYDVLDRILVIDAPEEERLLRTQRRDNLPREKIAAILNAQVTREKRLAAADDIIYNDRDLTYLKQQVLQLHQRYLTLAQKTH